jgi:anion-transporting  ArsA/GET3 family ATPase
VFGGFRQRAQQTYALLQASGTAFLVVAAPEQDALREAAYFVERLSGDRMPLAGLIVNRATTAPPGELSAAVALAAAERLREAGDAAPTNGTTASTTAGQTAGLTAGLLRLHADRVTLVERERQLRERFGAAHPRVPTAVVPALAGDVHDLDGLREVGRLLSGA